jgi:SAM-dependent methyltransferase
MDASTLERLVPDDIRDETATGLETLKLHLERYDFAAAAAQGPRVLDMACGVGYGSARIAELRPDVSSVTGVDLSAEAIAYATRRYSGPRTRFLNADAMTYSDGAPYDTIVSLETIEHLPDPRGYARRLPQLLAPDGVLVASVPITPSVDGNPHHLHDFSERSFLKMMVEAGFAPEKTFYQDQPFSPFAVAFKTDKRMADARPSLAAFYLRRPDKLLLRLKATLVHGFKNRYATVVFRKAAA